MDSSQSSILENVSIPYMGEKIDFAILRPADPEQAANKALANIRAVAPDYGAEVVEYSSIAEFRPSRGRVCFCKLSRDNIEEFIQLVKSPEVYPAMYATFYQVKKTSRVENNWFMAPLPAAYARGEGAVAISASAEFTTGHVRSILFKDKTPASPVA